VLSAAFPPAVALVGPGLTARVVLPIFKLIYRVRTQRNMKKTLLYLPIGICSLLVLPVLTLAAESTGPTIKKCQDATGKWHYGDSAAAACSQSKVTVISEGGITKKEIAAPLSTADLKRRDEQEEELAKAKEQAKQDELLLATYANEADITYIRDRKLAQVESVIRASLDTLNPLRGTLGRLEAQAIAEQKACSIAEQTTKALEQTRQQISKHELVVTQKRQEQDQIRARADNELARYRALRSKSAGPRSGDAPGTASRK
jgi:hypothetical protein